jgi:hypothetical protein
MPPRITLGQRQAIKALYNRGWGIYKIAQSLKLGYKTVKLWANRTTMTDKPRNMKPISLRTLHKMKKDLIATKSLRKTAKRHGYSHEFIRKKLRRSAANPHGLYPYKSQQVLRLSKSQKEKRINYIKTMPYDNATELLSRLKRKVIYDEKPFELGHPPNKQTNRQWSYNTDDLDTYPMDKNPNKIHVMASITYFNKSKLFWYLEEDTYKKGNYLICMMHLLILNIFFVIIYRHIIPHIITGKNKGKIKYIHCQMDSKMTIKALKEVVIPCADEASALEGDISFELEGDNA